MNLIQRAMQKVFGQGESRAARERAFWRKRVIFGERIMKDPVSRQTLRAKLRDQHYQTTSGATRRERRNLARALAARDYKAATQERTLTT